MLWAFAVNTFVSNFDTYNGYYVHNYYLYQDEQGRFQMIPWDARQVPRMRGGHHFLISGYLKGCITPAPQMRHDRSLSF